MIRSHALSRLLRGASRLAMELRNDSRATAAVETALILPVAMTMFALLIYGAEAFSIQRKVTVTARTVTDLITQSTPQMNGGKPSVPQSSIDTDLGLASSVMAPYSSSNLSMVASEVLINADQATATVQWSEPYSGATARATGSVVTLPVGLGTGQAGNYFVLGEVYYNYTPINFFFQSSAMTLHDAIYLTPRQANSLAMLVGQ